MAFVKGQPFKPQFDDGSGNLLNGGTVEFQDWDTSTPVNYYTDSGGTVGGTSLTLNSRGEPPSDIFFDTGQNYKLILKDSAGSTVSTIGPYQALASTASNATVTKEYKNGSDASSRVFTLTNSYTLGNNNLKVLLNGVELRKGSSFDYTETSGSSVTLTYDPLDNDVYTFVTSETTTSTVADAAGITYTPGGSGAVATNVQAKLRGIVSVLDYGADNTGAADAGTAFQNANDSLSSGGVIKIPTGTYLLSTKVDLSSNITLEGEGDSTLLVFDVGLALNVDTKTHVTFKNFKIRSENYFMYFKLSNNIRVENVIGVGLRTTGGDLSQYHALFEGCDEVDVINPVLDNYNYGYLFAEESGSSTRCGYVRVNGGVIEHTDATHGTSIGNPSGINAWRCKSLKVSGTTFKNIKPSGAAGSPFYGFGVYEGDGDPGDCDHVSVKDCLFIDDDGYTTTRPMCGVLTSVADESVISNNEFIGDFIAIQGGTRSMLVSDNKFNGAWVYTSVTTGVSGYTDHNFTGNTWTNVTEAFPFISMNNSGEKLDLLNFVGNTIQVAKFGVYLRSNEYCNLVGNTLIDLNTNGITDDTAGGGFNFSGTERGLVDGNTIMNVSTGKMEYGVISASSTNQIVVTENNNIRGMEVSAVKNGFTTAPTTGTWDVGNKIKFWSVSAGGSPGAICTTAGTNGTLNSGATTGSITTGTTALSVNSATGLEVRQKITIAGVTGVKTVTAISGTDITIDSNADATVSGAAVAFSNAVFKNEANISA